MLLVVMMKEQPLLSSKAYGAPSATEDEAS